MSWTVDSGTGCFAAQSCSVSSAVGTSRPWCLRRSAVHDLDLDGRRRGAVTIEQRRLGVQARGEATGLERADVVLDPLVIAVQLVVLLDLVLTGRAGADDGLRVQRRCLQ